ncbi:MAG: 4-alpha-glucanotransferase [Candidatus Omnitrophota bacterium]|nr:4-alpha-glucanotransferase [Candidatus Omnitrophota bacterium]
MPGIKGKERTLKRMAGVLSPLFSIYSDKSLGIGGFEDMKLLSDWCDKTGISIIQLLPMNEVGSTFCPYDSISSFALEPMYISLEGQGKEEKKKLLRDIFVSEKSSISDSGFKKFVKENAYWLDDFGLYKALKGYHKGVPWYEWKDLYKNRDSFALKGFAKDHKEETDFHKWVQWTAFGQFKAAKEYANSKNILIKGDLPILVSRDSADVWAHQEFFKLEYAAGAPPDMYCALGQRWGMPTYNWERIESDGFTYIKEKLKFAQNFYDLLRIDHVVGLFRIWSIPYDEPMENRGLNGFFDPKDESIWRSQGRKLLSVLQENTNMILCAEDLGVIPKVCTDTLKEMKIPGNDVQRWVKDWQVTHDFLPSEKYRELSVAMLSTHDTTNWAAWWENEAGTVDEELFARRCAERGIDYGFVKSRLFDASRSKHGRLRWRQEVSSAQLYVETLGKAQEELRDFIEFYENTYLEKEKLWKQLKIKGPMREKSDPEIVEAALKITAQSESIYCIELIFDLLNLSDICKGDPYKYRINRPGTVSPGNWSLKIPISLEELLKHKVNGKIKKIISASGRAQKIGQ